MITVEGRGGVNVANPNNFSIENLKTGKNPYGYESYTTTHIHGYTTKYGNTS